MAASSQSGQTGQQSLRADGYPAVGALMGNHPELAIFRRFKDAAALDLLYRQADLQNTIKAWADLNIEDQTQSSDASRFDYNFLLLQRSEKAIDPEFGMQWRLWCTISDKLDQYYEKLLRFQKVASLAAPDRDNLQALRQYLDDPNQGGNFLVANEELIYKEWNEKDLTSLAHPDLPDWFTKLVRGPATSLLHYFKGKESEQTLQVPRLGRTDALDFKLKRYPDDVVQGASRCLYALLTSGLIILAIATLRGIRGQVTRLVIIFFHNLGFTLALALLTRVKPGELFAAAATYGAVLVVFASDALASGGASTT